MTDPIPLPSGATLRVQIPGPPTILAAAPASPGVIMLPVPGPAGSAELSPEQLAQLADDTGDQVLEDLEPPVDLVILFENGLA